MATSTLRPSSTVANTGDVTGASAHAALADDSDATFVYMEPVESCEVALGDLSLPAGAVIKRVSVRTRTKWFGAIAIPAKMQTTLKIAPANLSQQTVVNWGSPTTTTVLTSAAPYTDAAVDAATLLVESVSGGDPMEYYAAYVDVTYVAQPTVDSITVGDGSDPLTENNRPTISWVSTLDADGGPQNSFKVRIFDSATYGGGGFDPDTSTPVTQNTAVQTTETSWTPDEPLADGTYRAYVFVRQWVNGGPHDSDWAFEEFEIDVDRPGVPTITATAEDAKARIKLDLDDSTGDTTTDIFEVEASYDGGTTWQTLRTTTDDGGDGQVVPESGLATVYDAESPNGTEATYRARAVHTFSSGLTSRSDWSTTDTATWTSTSWWLKSPTDLDLNIAVTPRSQPGRSQQPRQAVLEVLGRADPVVISDSPGATQGELVLISNDDDERDALDALRAEVTPILVQAPASTNAWEDTWIVVTNFDRQRVVDASWVAPSFDSLSWVEVKRPEDDLVGWPS